MCPHLPSAHDGIVIKIEVQTNDEGSEGLETPEPLMGQVEEHGFQDSELGDPCGEQPDLDLQEQENTLEESTEGSSEFSELKQMLVQQRNCTGKFCVVGLQRAYLLWNGPNNSGFVRVSQPRKEVGLPKIGTNKNSETDEVRSASQVTQAVAEPPSHLYLSRAVVTLEFGSFVLLCLICIVLAVFETRSH